MLDLRQMPNFWVMPDLRRMPNFWTMAQSLTNAESLGDVVTSAELWVDVRSPTNANRTSGRSPISDENLGLDELPFPTSAKLLGDA